MLLQESDSALDKHKSGWPHLIFERVAGDGGRGWQQDVRCAADSGGMMMFREGAGTLVQLVHLVPSSRKCKAFDN